MAWCLSEHLVIFDGAAVVSDLSHFKLSAGRTSRGGFDGVRAPIVVTVGNTDAVAGEVIAGVQLG
jgi:hypothetical protein